MPCVLRRVEKACPDISSIIDVGAASGTWSLLAHTVFPSCDLLAAEPLQDSFATLKLRLKSIPGCYPVQAVVSDINNAEIEYSISPDRDGSGVGLAGGVKQVMSCRTIDSLVDQYQLQPPYLLKLDTHGHEVSILKGAARTLEKTSVVVVEVYNYKISDQSLFFWDFVQVMKDYGFRPFDLADPSPRPLDQSLWQFDIVFLPTCHPAFTTNAYSG